MNKPALAVFVSLVVVALGPQPAMSQVTWSQPPLEIDPNIGSTPLLCGSNESARSTQYEGARRNWRMDADDFRCSGPMPVTAIRWWGGYKGWQSAEPPLSPQPAAWHIGFWANLVEGLDPNALFPERLVWSVEIPSERVQSQAVGLDGLAGPFPEMCFAYEVGLEPEEWFHQGEFPTHEGLFWISITAIYPTAAEPKHMWGWHTRPQLWGRGAVMPAIMGEWPDPEERLFPGRIYPIENALQCGDTRACDMCFELRTAESWVHHDQPFTGLRNSPGVAGHRSAAVRFDPCDPMVIEQVVDDWTCNGVAPIMAVAWHGSYLGHEFGACGCEAGAEPRRPEGFLFRLWSDGTPRDPTSGGYPARQIWEYEVFEYDEVQVGYARNGEGRPVEPVFRYAAQLPEPVQFQPEAPGSVYWLAIVAIFNVPVDDLPYAWCWTDHPHTLGMGARTMDATHPMPRWTELVDAGREAVDMSFTLYAVPEPNAVPPEKAARSDG
ncbi:MAG: hypothetical protein JSW27_00235 [Phycisphaerales bacterium]|nr:MAG: hypothetical protein JSW27_00235 [Phycisphaerales bacterium]